MTRAVASWKLILIGVVGGALGGGLGLGGGFIMVPLLLFFGFDRHRAHATSLGGMMMIAAVGAGSFGLGGQIDFGTGVLVGVGGMVGSSLGAQIMHRSAPRTLRLVFGGVLILVALRFLLGGAPQVGVLDPTPFVLVVAGLAIGVAAGLIAGVAGVGGGVVVVPGTIFLLGLTQHEAQGTSLTAIVFTSAAATLVNVRNRRILLQEGLLVGAGGAAGSIVGSQAALAIDDRTLAAVFGLVVLAIAANTIWESIKEGRKAREQAGERV